MALSALVPFGMCGAISTPASTILVNILSSANPAETGIPFELTADTSPSGLALQYNWSDSLGDSSVDVSWQLDVHVPGNLTVTLHVRNLLGALGEATLRVGVRPSLSVTVSSPLTQVDAGIPNEFSIDVHGGVGPFTSAWNPTGGGPNGTAAWPVAGDFSEPVTFWTPGPGWIGVRVADALGGLDAGDRLVTQVVPPGALELATNGSVAEAGWPIGVAVAVQEGTPPFQWSLSSSVPLAGDSATFGVFPSDGMYRWNVSFAWPGSANLSLTSVDATGALRVLSTGVVVEPPLTVELPTPTAESPGPSEVSANVSGGLPPYSCQFLLSDGETSNESLAAAGTVVTTFEPTRPGNFSVEYRVTDALGRRAVASETVRILEPPAASSLPAQPDLALVGGVGLLFLILLLAGLFAYRRRRRRADDSPSVDSSALPVVRQLMRQSQIIDRESLLMLGEEAGEPPDAVRTAIASLIRTGEVTTEPGPGPDEVLRWRDVAAAAPVREEHS